MKENRENLEWNNTENSFNWFLEKLNQPITFYITNFNSSTQLSDTSIGEL